MRYKVVIKNGVDLGPMNPHPRPRYILIGLAAFASCLTAGVLGYLAYEMLPSREFNILELMAIVCALTVVTGVYIYLLTRLFTFHRYKVEQDDYIDNIRRALQHPLATIKNASASQMKLIAEENFSDVRKMGSYVHAQTARLQQVIDQLNKKAKVNITEGLQKRTVSLPVFFDHCHQDMKIKHAHRNVNISISLNPENLLLDADPFYLKTAILNVLDNVYQFNESDEDLHVELSANQLHDEVRIQISDNGIGLDHEESKKVGRKYYRPAQHNHIFGLGLGLFQAKEIIKAHGGRMRVRSDTTAGFTVEFFIPSEL